MLEKNNISNSILFNKIKNIKNVKNINQTPFSEKRLEFLSDVSKKILDSKICKKYPDLISLGFWLRKNNLKRISNEKLINVIGLGCIFHITPNNVPTNFFYSFTFGFLCGNSNLVKLPNINYDQVNILIKILNNVFNKKKYFDFKKCNIFFTYDSKNKNLTYQISTLIDARIIWGNDNSIIEIKKISENLIIKDIIFKNRYSLSIISSEKFKNLSKKLKNQLILNFYNDAYLFDQNACTSPHLIIWFGKKQELKKTKFEFYKILSKIVEEKYDFDEAMSLKKFEYLSDAIIKYPKKIKYVEFSKKLHVLEVTSVDENLYKYFNRFGIFLILKLLNLANYQINLIISFKH